MRKEIMLSNNCEFIFNRFMKFMFLIFITLVVICCMYNFKVFSTFSVSRSSDNVIKLEVNNNFLNIVRKNDELFYKGGFYSYEIISISSLSNDTSNVFLKAILPYDGDNIMEIKLPRSKKNLFELLKNYGEVNK